MLTLLLLLHLSWTNPLFHGPCSSNGDTLRDLARVEVWIRTPAGPLLLAQFSEVGREGARDSATVTAPSDAVGWVLAWDLLGQPSCPVVFNLSTEAVSDDARVQVRWYDVAGRCVVPRPTAPGIYFERLGGRTRKVLVIR